MGKDIHEKGRHADNEVQGQYPDDLIDDIRWMSAVEIQSLVLTYLEDKEFLIKQIEENE